MRKLLAYFSLFFILIGCSEPEVTQPDLANDLLGTYEVLITGEIYNGNSRAFIERQGLGGVRITLAPTTGIPPFDAYIERTSDTGNYGIVIPEQLTDLGQLEGREIENSTYSGAYDVEGQELFFNATVDINGVESEVIVLSTSKISSCDCRLDPSFLNPWMDTLMTESSEYGFIAIDFYDKNIGIVVSYDNFANSMYKTADGGHSWTKLSFAPTSFILDVDFATASKVIVTTDESAYVSNDAGASFALYEALPTALQIHVIDENSLIAINQSNEVMYSDDGGMTWHLTTTTTSGWHDQKFSFTSTGVGFMKSGTNLWKTTDNGHTWEEINGPINNDVVTIHFVDANKGYGAGMFDFLIETTDGGKVWEKADSLWGYRSFVYFDVTGSRGIAGGDFLHTTANGGETWVMTYDRLNAKSISAIDDIVFIATYTDVLRIDLSKF